MVAEKGEVVMVLKQSWSAVRREDVHVEKERFAGNCCADGIEVGTTKGLFRPTPSHRAVQLCYNHVIVGGRILFVTRSKPQRFVFLWVRRVVASRLVPLALFSLSW